MHSILVKGYLLLVKGYLMLVKGYYYVGKTASNIANYN